MISVEKKIIFSRLLIDRYSNYTNGLPPDLYIRVYPHSYKYLFVVCNITT